MWIILGFSKCVCVCVFMVLGGGMSGEGLLPWLIVTCDLFFVLNGYSCVTNMCSFMPSVRVMAS